MEQFTSEKQEASIYFAAERVPPGIYQEIESLRQIVLQEEGYLPASLDGRVACYQRMRLLAPSQTGTQLTDTIAHSSMG